MNNSVRGTTLLTLFLVATSAPAGDEIPPDSAFIYKEDWAVVSAPPPPGPYRAVNIDPRIPGVDATPPMPVESASSAAEPVASTGIPAAALNTPPAAGAPAIAMPQDRPAQAANAPLRQPVPARTAPATSPGYYYPAQPRYPAQSRYAPPPAAYRNYQQQPAYGYYGAPSYPRQQQQQVPPPPVYDAMLRNRTPSKGMP